MAQNVNAEIVAIGTEILLGEITDTNSVYLARVLRDLGINIYFMTSVGDNEQRIADAIRIAMSRADLVITCGGLGPTVDDMTRQSVAAATNRGLTFHQDLLDKIAERFAGFRSQMTENNKRQAYLPDNSIVVENPVGTAPSFIVEFEGRSVISLPGVPREMKYLMMEKVVPYLREHFQLTSEVIKAKVLKTAGIGESALDSQIGDELLQLSNPTVGLAAHAGQVDVRITAKANSEAEADQMISVIEVQIREKVGQFIFGVDAEKIEDVLGQLLSQHSATVAVTESGISDPVSRLLKASASGAQVLKGVEMYVDPAALRKHLQLPDDLPLRELAERAAEAVSQQTGATAGIAVIAHPEMDEIHADSEAGTAFAVFCNQKMRSRTYGFGGKSDTAQEWAGTWAMSMLWQMLIEQYAKG